MKTKVVRVIRGEEVNTPLKDSFGFCYKKAEEDGLIFYPSAEDKKGFILTDTELENLGYVFVGTGLHPKSKYFVIKGGHYYLTRPTSANWIAKNKDESIYVFDKKPVLENGKWVSIASWGYRIEGEIPLPYDKSLRKLW